MATRTRAPSLLTWAPLAGRDGPAVALALLALCPGDADRRPEAQGARADGREPDLAAWLFRRLLPTRWMPAFAFTGVPSVAAGAVLLLVLSRANASALVPIAALLLGYGAAAGVAPDLFMAGLSVPSPQIGPTFALVELLRSQTAFLIVPAWVAGEHPA